MSSASPLSESPARWLSAQLRRVPPSPPALALVDLRPAEDYRRGHLRGSTNLPWTEFVPRDFELPARGAHLCVLGTAATLSSALPYLAKRGYPVDRALCLDRPAGPPGPLDPRDSPEPPEPRGPQDAPAAARPDRELERLDLADPELRDLLECGPQSRRLWKACPFLAEHIATIEQQLARPVSECLAVDLASGNGRDGVFLAARGWGVAAIDYNTSSLARALLLAHNERVPFRAICADLEADPASPVSPAAPEPCDGESKGAGREFSSLVMDAAESALLVPFEKAVERLTLGEVFALRADLVHVARYLHRPLFPLIRDMIRPGGFVVYHTFMRGAEKYGKPRKDRFLLEHEELLSVFAGWHVVHYAEAPISPADQDPRPAAFLVARKPA